MGWVKTTLEIPDAIFRRAKSVAAERGIPLREFVTQAVKDKLASENENCRKTLGKARGSTETPSQRNRIFTGSSDSLGKQAEKKARLAAGP